MRNFTGAVPNLVLAQRVIDKMVAGAKQFIADETGEAMVGIVDPGAQTGVPTIYVLDTIPPDETNVVREYYMFQQGDERQYEIFTWLNANWKTERKKLVTGSDRKYDAPLMHVGDWHKQPGFMTAPSRGDLMSALAQIEDSDDTEFLLVPIVTLEHETAEAVTGANYLYVADGNGKHLRIDFWYIARGLRDFLPVLPTVYPDAQVPPMPPLPWHLAHAERAADEISALERDGFLVSPIIFWEIDGEAPLEICLMMARAGEDKMLIVTTHHDYPQRAPRIYQAPFASMDEDDDWYDVFEALWRDAKLVDAPHDWTPENTLIDRVYAMENRTRPVSDSQGKD